VSKQEAGRCQPAPPCSSQAPRSALGSHPCVALSSAGAKGVFPVSVSLGVYRAGNGKRGFAGLPACLRRRRGRQAKGRRQELIAGGVPRDQSRGRELGQGGTQSCGAHTAELAQAPQGGGLGQSRQGLAHPLGGGWRRLRWGGSCFHDGQGQGGTGLGELERDVVAARSGAVLGGQGQLGASAPEVEIGVAPAVQFAGAAQGLAGAAGVGVFAGVVDQHHGQFCGASR